MSLRVALAGAGCLLALPVLTVGAHAGPAPAMDLSANAPAMAQPAATLSCYRYKGRRRCRWYYVREYGFPEHYRTGSTRWWQEMDRIDRGGRGRR